MVESIRSYGLIAVMWIRAAMVYRATFVMLALSQFAVTGLDFVAIFIMFAHTPQLGGFGLAEVAFLYATSGVAMGLADLLVGNVERIGLRIRDGSLDTMLVRPVPALVQVAADQFALARLGRITQAAGILVWATLSVDIDWTWDRVLLFPVMIVAGTGIFCGIFLLGAAFQFLAKDASEVMNAFTYGGNTLTQYPPTIYARDLIKAVTFGIPLAFVNWIPAMHLLDRPDPLGLPWVFGFASPIVAAIVLSVAGLAWRAGVRSYRSTGS